MRCTRLPRVQSWTPLSYHVIYTLISVTQGSGDVIWVLLRSMRIDLALVCARTSNGGRGLKLGLCQPLSFATIFGPLYFEILAMHNSPQGPKWIPVNAARGAALS
jgi:hypothetical protein